MKGQLTCHSMTEKQSYNNELEKGRRRKRRKWLMLWSLMLRMMLPHTHTSEREAATKIRELFFLILPKSIHQHTIGTSFKHLEENVSFSTIWKSLLKLLSWASNILWKRTDFTTSVFPQEVTRTTNRIRWRSLLDVSEPSSVFLWDPQ